MMRLPKVKVTAMSHVGAPPWLELYGFRSSHGKFFLLSPFEFHMWWRPVRLWPPCHAHSAGRTEWTAEGLAHYLAHKDEAAPVPLEPGKHYIVRSMGARPEDQYYLYPDEPQLHRFRHEWVLKCDERPPTPSAIRNPDAELQALQGGECSAL